MNQGIQKRVRGKVQKGYLSVSELEEYSGISRRTLWDLLKDPVNPIPHFRIGSAGRIVRVSKDEFNQWMQNQRGKQNSEIDRIVDEIFN